MNDSRLFFSEKLRRMLWRLVAGILLLVALYVILVRQLMTLLPEFETYITSEISAQVGQPVKIGGISGRVEGVTPIISLMDFEIIDDARNQSPLVLQKVDVAIDVLASLLARGPRLQRLLIEGLAVHLQRDDHGGIRLRGQTSAAEGSSVPARRLRDFLEPLYRQRRVEFRRVHAIIDWGELPTIETKDLALVLVNSGERHYLAVRFSLLDEALRLDAKIHLYADAFEISEIDGRAYFRLRGQDLGPRLATFFDAPLALSSAAGEVVFWTDVVGGKVVSGHADVDVRNVELQHAMGTRWALPKLAFSTHLHSQDARYTLELTDLDMGAEGESSHMGPLALRWDRGQLSMQTSGLAMTDETHWELMAGMLDLAELREQLMEWPFPITEQVVRLRDKLERLAPGGRVSDLRLVGSGKRLQSFSGRLDDISVVADQKQPGVSGLSGWIAGTPQTGVAVLDSRALLLELPEVFDSVLDADVRAPMVWQQGSDSQWHLYTGFADMVNPDLEGKALLDVHLLPGHEPRLSLIGEIREADVAQAARYIPAAKVSRPLSDWFSAAFVSGQITQGRFLYEGPVRGVGEHQELRTFQMMLDAQNVNLNFQEGWPLLQQVSGMVHLSGRDIFGRGVSAKYLGSDIKDASFDIERDVSGHWLQVSGHVDGRAQDLDQIFQHTPLASSLPDPLRQWRFPEGTLRGNLLLHLPLSRSARSTGRREVLAQGSVHDAIARADGYDLAVGALTGDFHYSLNNGIQSSAFSATILDRPVQGFVTTHKDVTTIQGKGKVTAAALQHWQHWPWLATLSGEAGYDVQLSIPRKRDLDATLTLTSSLQGMAVQAPLPLVKPAADVRRSTLKLYLGEHALDARFSYGDIAAGQLMTGRDGTVSARIGLGEVTAHEPRQPGWEITGWVPRLETTRWLAFLDSFDTSDDVLTSDSVQLAIETDSMELAGLETTHGKLWLRSGNHSWSLDVISPELAAHVSIPDGYSRTGAQPAMVEISHLHLPAATGKEIGRIISPDTLPIADVVIRSMSVGEEDYGRWSGKLRPDEHGVRVEDFDGQWRHAEIRGELAWRNPEGQQFSSFRGEVQTRNLRRLLNAWALEPFMESGNARSQVDVRWPGSPLDFDYMQLQGHASVDIKDAFLPGSDRRRSALQLLGLVNIANITRRLRLDFSDASRRGLSCESISGDFAINGTDISTTDLVISSTAAEFQVRGRLDMANKLLDHRIDMTLPISSNLYAGCIAGPAACAGIFVVERLWGEKIEKLATLSYRVSGTWQDPEVKEASSTRGARQ